MSMTPAQLVAGRDAGVNELVEPLEKQDAVRQPGQRVVQRQVIEPLLLGDVVRKMPCPTPSRAAGAAPLHRTCRRPSREEENTGEACPDDDRQQRERVVAFLRQCRSIGYARVAGDVVGDHRLRAAQRESKKALGVLAIAVVLVDYLLEKRRAGFAAGGNPGHAAGIQLDHPRQHEFARRDRDPARLPEQFAAIANAHDRAVDPAQHGVHAVQAPDPRIRLLSRGDIAANRDDQRLAARIQRAAMKLGPAFAAIAAHEGVIVNQAQLPGAITSA
jgi:hypothetical protein